MVPVDVKFSLFILFMFSLHVVPLQCVQNNYFLTELDTVKLFDLTTRATSQTLITGILSAIMSLNISSEILSILFFPQ